MNFTDPFGLFCIPLGSQTTPWEVTWRGSPTYELTGVFFSDLTGPLGYCNWLKSVEIIEMRLKRSIQLCYECEENCGQKRCSWKIRYGSWNPDFRPNLEVENKKSRAIRFGSGDPEEGDYWMCDNPWTGGTARGRM